jgi:hypothetical protein
MKRFGWLVIALVVLVMAVAVIVPVAGGVVARSDGGSTAALCQSGFSCGGNVVAEITPTPVPPGPDALCQSSTSCGG